MKTLGCEKMIRRIVRVGIQLFFTVRIDLYLTLKLQVFTVYLNLIAPVATNRADGRCCDPEQGRGQTVSTSSGMVTFRSINTRFAAFAI
jgi:hypothetical protein